MFNKTEGGVQQEACEPQKLQGLPVFKERLYSLKDVFLPTSQREVENMQNITAYMARPQEAFISMNYVHLLLSNAHVRCLFVPCLLVPRQYLTESRPVLLCYADRLCLSYLCSNA